MQHDSKEIRYGLGSGANLGKTKTMKETIEKFESRFFPPLVTKEKFHEYKKMTDAQQRHIKGSNGWFMRAAVAKGQNRNRNSILPSQMITLDLDYATPEFLEQIRNGEILPGYKLFVHSSRSHTPENPRLRMIVYLKGNLDRDDYGAASRIVAQKADPNLEYTDKVSFRAAQMMYMPTVSKDMEKHFVWYKQDGELLDHEEIIGQWELLNGSASDIGNLPRTPDEDELRESAEKAENPTEKKGMVGNVCRAYTVTDLINGKDGEPGLLADTYEVVEEANGAISRMTYLKGTTSNGAVVYDDMWVWSHHGSDPCQEQLVNVYDLLRIHKFGDLDKDADKDTPLSKLPSTKKMTEWLRDDPHYRVAQAESRYDLDAMLTDDDVEYDDDEEEDEDDPEADDLLGLAIDAAVGKVFRPKIARKKADKPGKGWLGKECELTDEGRLKATLHNLAHIITNDPRLWRKIAFNEFSQQIVILGDIKSKNKMIPSILCDDPINGTPLQDIHEITIQAILDGPTDKNVGYGLQTSQQKIGQAIQLAARHNAFHPIREYLQHCSAKVKYKKGSLRRLFVDYFGAEENVYNLDVAEISMVAAVARVMEPGCKYDFAPIFEGSQGIGKSTAIRRLFGNSYFGEIDGNLGNRQLMAEQTQGNWANELPELSAMGKSDANDAKSFMSRDKDDVRMAYGKHVSKFPRQFVVYGTTNDQKYLRDTTGGRRYWPILLHGTTSIDVLGIMRDRDALWAEAYDLYIEMRSETPTGDLPLFLEGESEQIALKLQESRRVKETWEGWLESVEDWMDEPVRLQALLAEYDNGDEDFGLDGSYMDVSTETMVERVAFTQNHVFDEAFGFHAKVPANAQPDLLWQKVLARLEEDGWERQRCRIGGKLLRWVVRPDLTPDERRAGFRLADQANAPGIGDHPVSDDDDDDNPLL